jgi:hypothetical protein
MQAALTKQCRTSFVAFSMATSVTSTSRFHTHIISQKQMRRLLRAVTCPCLCVRRAKSRRITRSTTKESNARRVSNTFIRGTVKPKVKLSVCLTKYPAMWELYRQLVTVPLPCLRHTFVTKLGINTMPLHIHTNNTIMSTELQNLCIALRNIDRQILCTHENDNIPITQYYILRNYG